MPINHSKNANPQRPKNKKLRIRKAKPMDSTSPSYNRFREVIIPAKTDNKFKLKDVFEVSSTKTTKKTTKKKKK